MSEEAGRGAKPIQTEERVDGLLVRIAARRREAIRKSMERPLRVEALRTGYIVGCLLLDLILAPIALASFFGRPGLYLSAILVIPLLYLEYRAHGIWFDKDWSSASKRVKAE